MPCETENKPKKKTNKSTPFHKTSDKESSRRISLPFTLALGRIWCTCWGQKPRPNCEPFAWLICQEIHINKWAVYWASSEFRSYSFGMKSESRDHIFSGRLFFSSPWKYLHLYGELQAIIIRNEYTKDGTRQWGIYRLLMLNDRHVNLSQ